MTLWTLCPGHGDPCCLTDRVLMACHMGTQALYRTNHVYDPKMRADNEDSVSGWAFPDSVYRYMLIANAMEDYEKEGQPIGELEALTMTSLAAQKVCFGPDIFYGL